MVAPLSKPTVNLVDIQGTVGHGMSVFAHVWYPTGISVIQHYGNSAHTILLLSTRNLMCIALLFSR